MQADRNCIEGGCACGGVRYRLTSAPMFVHCCHCRECQRLSGGAFALNALIEADRVQLLRGDVDAVLVPSTSGLGQKICRCPDCQVALWSHYALQGGIGDRACFVRVGTLDDPDRLPPDIHIYTASKQPWVALPPGAHVVEEYYDYKHVWPADSIARRAALKDQLPSA